ncbi:MAG TPA: hypothetical protein VGS00_08575 [Thermoanaerobaculia bacterium]|nr:hypothetical protein [Thermoanaerobaculia bacterium]
MKEEPMANGSSRLVPALLALLVGFAIGWFIPHPEPAAAPGAGPPRAKFDDSAIDSHLIGVHGDGSVTLPKANISLLQKNIVAWNADAHQSLVIAFKEKGFPKDVNLPPFKGMTSRMGPDTGLKEWIVRCGGPICFSGDINSDLTETLNTRSKLEYKYDQIVAGKRTDGMIIINP